MQRDAKMVSYKVVDKETKPYIEVEISGEKKVRCGACLSSQCAAYLQCEASALVSGWRARPTRPCKAWRDRVAYEGRHVVQASSTQRADNPVHSARWSCDVVCVYSSVCAAVHVQVPHVLHVALGLLKTLEHATSGFISSAENREELNSLAG